MAIEVHREPLYKRHYASICSGAFLYSIAIGFILLFLPLIISYNSSFFWLKEITRFQQPFVKYRYEVIFNLHGARDGIPADLYFSSSRRLNYLNGDSLRIPIIRSVELDNNLDGLTDRIEISVLMPLSKSESVSAFSAAIFFDVELRESVRFSTDAVSFINFQSPYPVSEVSIAGDLRISQSTAFKASNSFITPNSNNPLMTFDGQTDAGSASIANLLERSRSRNVTLQFKSDSIYTRRNIIPSNVNTRNSFNASINLRVPQQLIRYNPTVGEVLKFAWIQYVSFLVIISFLLFYLSSYVFSNQLLATVEVVDIVHEKLD